MNLIQDFRLGIRTAIKNPGFSFVAIATLALGIGATTAIFSMLNSVVLKPLPFKDPNELVVVWESDPPNGIEKEQVAPANFQDWKTQATSFQDMGFITNFGHNSRKFYLTHKERKELIQGRFVSSGFFRTMGVAPLQGRTFVAAEDEREGPRVCVISHALWKRQFGGQNDAVGRSVTVESYGRIVEYAVIGIMPSSFQFPAAAEIWFPAGWSGVGIERRGVHAFQVVGRLKKGVSIENAEIEMNTIAERIRNEHPEVGISPKIKVVSLLDQLVGGSKMATIFLFVAVLAVLLIACANVANLFLAKASTREREVALKLALGASRSRIVGQLLTESVVLSIVGGALGVVLAYWGVGLLDSISPSDIRTASVVDLKVDRLQEAQIDVLVLVVTAVCSILTGILFGLIPALHTSKANLDQVLREGGKGATSGRRVVHLRGILVIAQVAFAFVLLVGASLMTKNFQQLVQVDPGFDSEQVLTATIDWVSEDFSNPTKQILLTEQILEEAGRLPRCAICGRSEYVAIRRQWLERTGFSRG